MSRLVLPLAVLGAGLGLVKEVSGAGFSVARATGEVVAELLDEAIEALAEAGAASPAGAPTVGDATNATASGPAHQAKMQALLTRALEQTTTEAQDELFHRILDFLVPDEARIISALSDGSRSPMVSVHALTPAGMLGEALIERAALVGRTANVALPRLTPTYVGHLLSLGILEIGPEDESLTDEYQVLMAETDVLAAMRYGARGPVPPRVVRRTLRLAPLGRSLWHACFGGEE